MASECMLLLLLIEVNFQHNQSGTGRKTFQAISMPFWKEKTSNLTISLWKDFPSNSFFTENWKVFPSILMASFGWKTLPKHHFIANLASDRLSNRRVNDVICMFSLHYQAEKSWFYLINLIAI